MYKIGGMNVDELMNKVHGPMYVYDEEKLIKQMQDYKNNFKSTMFDTDVIYASKAFTCKEMLKLVSLNDLCLDVVSGGELYVANSVNFNPQNIYFHGNNKTDEEIRMAINSNVHTLVIDNMYEVERIDEISNELNKGINVLIRINPHIEAHTHEFIMTASVDSKFGISIDEVADIKQMIDKINNSKYITFDGYHSHIGSQILSNEGFLATADKMIKFAKDLGYPVNTMNFGGGFGVKYTLEDEVIPTEKVCKELITKIEESLNKYDLKINKACIEPGRSIVAEAGYTLYNVGFIKHTKNKNFCFIDGGMADNIRPALYDAKYSCVVGNKDKEKATTKYDIAGKCCESGDIIIKDVLLPEVVSGDILVVFTTGAYGYTMASNYNRLNKLPVVFVKDNQARIVIKGETYEDQLINECNEVL